MSDSHVYVQCKKHHWVPARIVEKRKDSAVVSVPQYRDEQSILSDAGKGALKYVRKTVKLSSYTNAVLPLQNVDEMGWLDEEKDMVNLPFLHEVRFCSDEWLGFLTTCLCTGRPPFCTISNHVTPEGSRTHERVILLLRSIRTNGRSILADRVCSVVSPKTSRFDHPVSYTHLTLPTIYSV